MGVTHYAVLRSPDFPPRSIGAITRAHIQRAEKRMAKKRMNYNITALGKQRINLFEGPALTAYEIYRSGG